MKKTLLALCLILAAVLFVGARTEWFDTLIVSGGYGSTGATITAGGAISTNGAIASDSTVTGSQLVSTVITGTAPITTPSTTKVTNLNADLLDGSEASAFMPAFGSQTAKSFYAAPNAIDGVPLFRAVAVSDIPTLNQNTTGSAAKWTTARTLAGNSVDGSANVAFPNKFVVQGTADAGLTGAQFLGALGTGIVKNTITTGVLSIAAVADFPTLNQDTTGTAANATMAAEAVKLDTARAINGTAFDGTAPITIGDNTANDITAPGSMYPVWVAAAGNSPTKISTTKLSFIPSTGILSATGFAGAVTGNVTGNVTGSSGSCTGLAATATALATSRAINGVGFNGTGPITVPVNNTNDTTLNASVYPLWTRQAGGNYIASVTTDDLYFNPFTGMLTVTGLTGPLTGTASNASQLLSKTWAAPAAIGTGTPAAITGTALAGTSLAITDYVGFNDTDYNTLIGYMTGDKIAVGAQFNTFVGYKAGEQATGTNAADSNTGVGYYALREITTGDSNVAVGNGAIDENTTGSYNIAIGSGAGHQNWTGNKNVVIGYKAMEMPTNNDNSTAVGTQALADNVGGDGNTVFGYYAGHYEIGANSFYVNNVDQTSTANDKAYSLLYGTFAGAAGSLVGQTLKVNGAFSATSIDGP
ncbi:MAG: hypothetical protein IMZ62_14700, partial [Chloroflexi bacterium]|nr:hypothetical protein [Chloroflexota bacterium]